MNNRLQRRLALIWALAVALLLAHQVWLWGVQKVRPATDIMALLPIQQRDPVLQASFSHMVDAAQQRVAVLIGAPDWPTARGAAHVYLEALDGQSVIGVDAPVSQQVQQDWLQLFEQHRILLISAARQQDLRTQDALWWSELAQRQLYSPFGAPKVGAWRDDPFGLFAEWVGERARETPVRPRDGLLALEHDGRQYVLITLALNGPVFSMATQRAASAALERAEAATRTAQPSADIISAGVVLHAAAATRQATGEVLTIGLGSLLGIVVLTWLCFTSMRPVLLVLLAIGIGSLAAISVCWTVFGQLHLITLVFGASLIGVAQDYGIFYLAHRIDGSTLQTPESLMRHLLAPLALTLAAAVLAYLALALTPFPGLSAMAVFSAVGLICAWLTVVCWFPLLAGQRAYAGGILAARYAAVLERLPRWQSKPAHWLAVLLLIALATGGLMQLRANDDIRLLQSSPPNLVSDQIRLARLLDAPNPVQYYLLRADTDQELLEHEELLKQRLDPLVAAHKISGYAALSNWVPSARRQQQNLALVQQRLLDGALPTLARAIGADQTWLGDVSSTLRDTGTPLTVAQFLAAPASQPWRHLWLGRIGTEYASIVALRGMSNQDLALLQRAGEGISGVQWVDKVGEISGILRQYRIDMAWLLGAAYLLVFGLLMVRYRTAALRVLTPVAGATLLSFALLGWLHQPVQLFHVLAAILLLGIGVDYGIFMTESVGTYRKPAWLAIGLSALNTLLSFGLLGLSNTAALQAFGLTMLCGVVLVWILVPSCRMAETAQANNPEHQHD